MAQFDLPLPMLEAYQPDVVTPPDFLDFWRETLDEAREHDLDADFTEIEAGLESLITEDVSFSGFGGHRITGWLVRPRGATEPLPTVVSYIGYGGGRNLVYAWTLLASAGYAQFVMDTRGQGAGWSTGDTPDPVGSDSALPGYMTRGILDPYDHYYRRVYTDAVRAVEAAASHPAVDADRLFVDGTSQGGGIALAVAGLSGAGLAPALRGVLADVPFLQHIRHATAITDRDPYHEVSRYLHTHREKVEQVFETLSYIDGTNFVPYATAPALYSVGLMDQTCPPSTVYASFNRYAGPKRIVVYPYNDHEGGERYQDAEHIAFLSTLR